MTWLFNNLITNDDMTKEYRSNNNDLYDKSKLDSLKPDYLVQEHKLIKLARNIEILPGVKYAPDSHNDDLFPIERDVFNKYNDFVSKYKDALIFRVEKLQEKIKNSNLLQLRNKIELIKNDYTISIRNIISNEKLDILNAYRNYSEIKSTWNNFKSRFSLNESEPKQTRPYSIYSLIPFLMLIIETVVNSRVFRTPENYGTSLGTVYALVLSFLNISLFIFCGNYFFKKLPKPEDKPEKTTHKINIAAKTFTITFMISAHSFIAYTFQSLLMLILGVLSGSSGIFEGFLRKSVYAGYGIKYPEIEAEYYNKKQLFEMTINHIEERFYSIYSTKDETIKSLMKEAETLPLSLKKEVLDVKNEIRSFRSTVNRLMNDYISIIDRYRHLFKERLREDYHDRASVPNHFGGHILISDPQFKFDVGDSTSMLKEINSILETQFNSLENFETDLEAMQNINLESLNPDIITVQDVLKKGNQTLAEILSIDRHYKVLLNIIVKIIRYKVDSRTEKDDDIISSLESIDEIENKEDIEAINIQYKSVVA